MNRDEDIFADALELPPEERNAFLDRACRDDPTQRARVAALLAAQEAAADFLESPPITQPEPLREEQPGDRIDRYLLKRRLGAGGCGVVYLAEQTTPISREVALKIIKLGMDTREVIARFEIERQTLAMMDHPGIARVFDAGATTTGRPYFVMEFVDGLPITDYCDRHSLDTQARLEIFSQVGLAIQHAHQKGVIHRDIKPSNVLVTLKDGVATPKVIDFGIAKATGSQLAPHGLLTSLGQLVGTPAYMSPEQVESGPHDIDTRSDIYCLGVLLYELLTGSPPHNPKSLVQAGAAEIRRIICEVDPPRPSTRLATLTDADRAAIARARRIAPPQLSATLRGDLDWIVMRCLEKERARRYDTAQQLVDDIRRHLRNEVVTARAPDALYRARKFVVRHRLACASAAIIAVTLVTATIVSLTQADRARSAEAQARTERDTARAAQAAEAVARTDAQRRQEQAEALLAFMLGDFRTELKKIGKLSLLDAVGDKAMAHFTALDPRDLTDTALTQQAKALTQIGEIRLDQTRYADALAAFETAYTRAAELHTRHPGNADMLFERAQAEYWIGFTARRRGNLPLTREWLTRYRDSSRALSRLEGETYRAQRELISGENNLAVLDFELGDLDRAQAGFLAAQSSLSALAAARPTDSSLQDRLSDVASWLGRVSETDGRYPDALEHYRRAVALMELLVEREPSVARWRSRLADSFGPNATLLAITGRAVESRELLTRAIALFEALSTKDPDNRQWRSLHLNLQLHLLTLQLADHSENTPELPSVGLITEFTSLAKAEPTSRVHSFLLRAAWRLEARLRLKLERSDAHEAIGNALEISGPAAPESSSDSNTLGTLAQTWVLAGRISRANGNSKEAAWHWQNVVDLLGKRADSRDWRILDPLAQAFVLLDDVEKARPLIERLRAFGYHPVDPLASSTLGLPRQP